MSKYTPKVYASEEVITKGHWAVDTEWNVKDYVITMHDKGFSCSCPAFRRCKHIKAVEEGFCDGGL